MKKLDNIISGIKSGYSITKSGVVYSPTGEQVATPIFNIGYKYITFSTGNKKNKKIPLHRVLALAFIKNPENLPCVNHKDGDKLNNSLENLEWCSYGKNNRHAYKQNLKSPGLTEEQRKQVVSMYAAYDGATQVTVAEEFGISQAAVSYLWKHKERYLEN